MVIGYLRIDLFVWWKNVCVVEKPLNSKCGLRVVCVGNRHDDTNIVQQEPHFIR